MTKRDFLLASLTFSSALGFLYDTERLPEPPRTWRELWAPCYRSELALFDFGSTLGPGFLAMAARLTWRRRERSRIAEINAGSNRA